MPWYQFYAMRYGEVEGSVDAEFANREAALSAARTGLAEGQEVEVWSGLQWVGLIEDRTDAPVLGGLSWSIECYDRPAKPFTWRHEAR